MTHYSKFNQWVYEYYISNCIPNELNTLSIPSSEIENFAFENDIMLNNFFELNRRSWINLLKINNEIPQYFGLIALQCLAAFKMQNKNGITAANYKDRLAEIIGISIYSDLNSFFSEDFDNNFKIQEKIWYSAKAFFDNKNIKIEIPKIAVNAGRFTQFPKSQIILNYEDLKEYVNFFKLVNKEFESIAFEDFKAFYFNKISNFKNSFRRKNNIKNDFLYSDIKREIKIKQIFDYYCTEDWEDLSEINHDKQKDSIAKFIIKIINNQLIFYDEFFNRRLDFDSFIRNKKSVIFRESKYYPNEFETANSFSFNDNNIYIVHNSPANQNEIRLYKRYFDYLNFIDEINNFILFKINYDKDLPNNLLCKFSKSHPIELIGFKVSGKKQYFVNHPPKIKCNNDIPYHIFFEKRKIQNSEINKIGKYSIKINGYSNFNFELIEVPVLDYPSNDKSKLLSFNSLEYEENEEAGINGLQIKYKNQANIETLTINNWIKANKGNKINSNIQLLKTISQSINGKY